MWKLMDIVSSRVLARMRVLTLKSSAVIRNWPVVYEPWRSRGTETQSTYIRDSKAITVPLYFLVMK